MDFITIEDKIDATNKKLQEVKSLLEFKTGQGAGGAPPGEVALLMEEEQRLLRELADLEKELEKAEEEALVGDDETVERWLDDRDLEGFEDEWIEAWRPDRGIHEGEGFFPEDEGYDPSWEATKVGTEEVNLEELKAELLKAQVALEEAEDRLAVTKDAAMSARTQGHEAMGPAYQAEEEAEKRVNAAHGEVDRAFMAVALPRLKEAAELLDLEEWRLEGCVQRAIRSLRACEEPEDVFYAFLGESSFLSEKRKEAWSILVELSQLL